MVKFELHLQYRYGMLAEGQADIVEKYIKENKSRKILHVGSSGNFDINKNVASLVDKVVCGDIFTKAMTNLKGHKFSNVTPVVMDVFNMPFKDESFDVVLAIGVQPLYSVKGDVARDGLAELQRVISRDGKLIVCNNADSGNYSFSEYRRVAVGLGYNVVEENISADVLGQTGARERYLFVFQK